MEVSDCNNLNEQSFVSNDDAQKMERLRSLELLKKKMCRSHELIQNYNDKLKECEQLKNWLRKAQAEANDMKSNYNTTLSKLIKLELQNTEHRKSLEASKKMIADYEIKMAGDQRLIQQLTCKIEDNEEKNADKLMDADLNKLKLEEKIKNLEQDIKSLKKSCNMDRKKILKDQVVKKSHHEEIQIVDTENKAISSISLGTKISENHLQAIQLNENTGFTDEKSSLLCTRCNAAFEKMLSSFKTCEPMIRPLSSPVLQIDINPNGNCTQQAYSPMEEKEVEEPEHLTDPQKEKCSGLDAIKGLERRLRLLERKIIKKKKLSDKNGCCHSNFCFPSPANQDLVLQIWRRLSDKVGSPGIRNTQKNSNRIQRKRKVIHKNKDKKVLEDWSIESVNHTCENYYVESSVFEDQNLLIDASMGTEDGSSSVEIEQNPFDKQVKKSMLVPEKLIEPITISENTKKARNTADNEEFGMMESSNKKISVNLVKNIETPNIVGMQEKDLVSLQKTQIEKVYTEFCERGEITQGQIMHQNSIKEKFPTDNCFDSSINKICYSCNKLVENEILKSNSTLNLPLIGEHTHSCKKFIRRRSTSCYSTNTSFLLTSRRNSSDSQDLYSENTQNLVTDVGNEDEEDKLSNFEKSLGFESLICDSSIQLDEVKTHIEKNGYSLLEKNNISQNSKNEDNVDLINQTEENMYPKSNHLTNELSLSGIRSLDEPEKNKSNFSLKEFSYHPKKVGSEASDIFISNSESCKVSKNFIHGKRSSNLLLTVISPKNSQKRFKKSDAAKNLKTGKRGTLLSKIRALKKRSNKVVSTTITRISQENGISEFDKSKLDANEAEASNSTVPTKKRRIAHVPKSENENSIINSFDDSSSVEVKYRKSLRSVSKPPKKLKTVDKKMIESSDLNVVNYSSFTSSEKEEYSSRSKTSESIEFPIIKKKGRPRKQDDLLKGRLLSVNLSEKELEAEKIPLPNSSATEKAKIEKYLSSVGKKDLESSESPDEQSSLVLRYDAPLIAENCSVEPKNKGNCKHGNILPLNGAFDEDIMLSSRILMSNTCNETTNECFENVEEIEKNNGSSFKELRSRHVKVAAKETVRRAEFVKKENKHNFLPVHPENPILRNYYVINLLNTNFNERKFQESVQKPKLSRMTLERNVRSHLVRLVESESWTMELHSDVIEKISSTCQAFTAAKCIVNFLQERFLQEEPLDKSNTPPAPMMTKTQQKIVTLICGLERQMPDIFYFVTAGIDYTLLRLGHPQDRKVIEGLARIHTVLARLKKDREKARLLCCDALYCHRINSMIIIYVVLTCWPEVFPIFDTISVEILPKCMAHIILTTEGSGFKFPKVSALKNLLTAYYQYPKADYFSRNLANEFLIALKHKHETSTDIAILLLAKKEGPEWTYKNIIQGGLLQMIVDKIHPSAYDAFTLLGNLLRSFPLEDKEGYISKTVLQLCDLLDSNQGTEDHLEGVATALLSISKFTNHFSKIAKSLLLWKPRKDLRPQTLTKFKLFFESNSVGWWHSFITNDYKMLSTQNKKNNLTTKKPKLDRTKIRSNKKKKKRKIK